MSLPFKSRDTAALQDHTVSGSADGKKYVWDAVQFPGCWYLPDFFNPQDGPTLVLGGLALGI